jgi:tRNA (guanine-N7-)-methyltransferase
MSAAPAAVPHGAAFWHALFGDDAPVEIEIGSGDGTFLLGRARAAPQRNLLGIERAPRKAQRLAARVARVGVGHLRTLHADATCVLAIVPAASVGAYHVYFPDPWPKRRHGRRRIFSPAFVHAVARTLVDGGQLYVATDVRAYMAMIQTAIRESGDFAELPPGNDHPGLDTAFARKYRAEGRMLLLARFARVPRAAKREGAQRCRDAVASKIRSS